MLTIALRAMVGIGIAALAVSCGGDEDSVTCEELAVIVADCGGLSAAEFRTAICDSVRLSSECLEEAAAADCSEHLGETEADYIETCFPSCSGDENECLGDDTIRLCAEGREFVFYCDVVCAELELTYTGTCSDTFRGETAEQDLCWCQ